MRTNEGNVHTTRSKRTTLCSPSQTVLENPGIKVVLLVLGETQTGICDTLEDVVVVLGCPENRRRRVRNVPEYVRS